MLNLYFVPHIMGRKEVSFDGVPFSVDKVSLLDCQYGVHYWKEKIARFMQDWLSCTHMDTHIYTVP